jgi:hypothetical protein
MWAAARRSAPSCRQRRTGRVDDGPTGTSIVGSAPSSCGNCSSRDDHVSRRRRPQGRCSASPAPHPRGVQQPHQAEALRRGYGKRCRPRRIGGPPSPTSPRRRSRQQALKPARACQSNATGGLPEMGTRLAWPDRHPSSLLVPLRNDMEQQPTGPPQHQKTDEDVDEGEPLPFHTAQFRSDKAS